MNKIKISLLYFVVQLSVDGRVKKSFKFPFILEIAQQRLTLCHKKNCFKFKVHCAIWAECRESNWRETAEQAFITMKYIPLCFEKSKCCSRFCLFAFPRKINVKKSISTRLNEF